MPRLAVTEQVVAADAEGAAQREAQLVGDHRHVLVALDSGQQDREHVARETRAIVSPWRSVLSRASATERSRSSPWLRPSRSLTAAKWSRPSWTTASLWRWRRAWTIATVRRSAKRRALARPGERVLVRERADLLLEALARRPFAASDVSRPRDAPRAGSRTSSSSWISRGGAAAGGALGAARRPRPGLRLSGAGGASASGAAGVGDRRRDALSGRRATDRTASSRAWASDADAIRRRHSGSRRAPRSGCGFARPGRRGSRARGWRAMAVSEAASEGGAGAGEHQPRLGLRGAPAEPASERHLGPLEPQAPHGGGGGRRLHRSWRAPARGGPAGSRAARSSARAPVESARARARGRGRGRTPAAPAAAAAARARERGVRRNAQVEVDHRVHRQRRGARRRRPSRRRAPGGPSPRRPRARRRRAGRRRPPPRSRGRAPRSPPASPGSRSRRARRARCRGRA